MGGVRWSAIVPTVRRTRSMVARSRVAGTTYAKGLGVHADSSITVDLTGMSCTRFQAVVGVDDEVGDAGVGPVPGAGNGSTSLFQSAVLTGASPTSDRGCRHRRRDPARAHRDQRRRRLPQRSRRLGRRQAPVRHGHHRRPRSRRSHPRNGATGIDVAIAPVARFSEPLDPATVSVRDRGLTVQPAGTSVVGNCHL